MSLGKFLSTKSAELSAGVCSKRERRKEARPGELLDAALDLFVEKGFAATRSEEVATRAGVSKGTLFLYFPSKEELFKAVVRKNISGRFEEWNAEFETFRGDTASMLRYCMNSWWERVGSTRASGITKLMMSEARNFPELAAFYQREVIEPGNRLIERVIQRGVDLGEFRDVDTRYAVHSVVSGMVYLMMWKHSMGACVSTLDPAVIDPHTFLSSHADLLLRGLCKSGTDSSAAVEATP